MDQRGALDTAYGTSACVTDMVCTYLLTKTMPTKGKTCTGEYQPFQGHPDSESNEKSQALRKNSPVAIPPTRPGLRQGSSARDSEHG